MLENQHFSLTGICEIWLVSIKGNSPLIREQFNTNDKLKVKNPRHLTSRRYMINYVLVKIY